MKRICWMAMGGLLISMCAAAQDNAAIDQAKKEAQDQAQQALTTATSTVMVRIIGPDREMLTAPVTGAPYSADEVTTFTQTLADGTHIQREDKVTVYRDSQGRLRRETPTEISITDPVAGVAYALDPTKLTARKQGVLMYNRATAVAPPDSGPATAAAGRAAEEALAAAKMRQYNYYVNQGNGRAAGEALAAAKMAEDQAAANARTFTIRTAQGSGPNTFVFLKGETDANLQFQSLGTQSIEGVLSEGTSANETIAVGAIGNDRPIQVVNERWYSSELKTTIMTKYSDPRTGEEVFRLTNIRRIEPSPDLFQVPAGYQVIGAGNTSSEAGQKR